jgi:5S rRNA maturation endonuclease (ribonuclease M5)
MRCRDLSECPLAEDGLPDIRYLVGHPTGPRTPLFLHCPAHGDHGRPNLAVYPNGTYCFACGFHETREEFWERLRSGQLVAVSPQPSGRRESAPPFDPVAIKLWHRTLLDGPRRDRLSYLLNRGLQEDMVRRFLIGHTGYRFSIPVWYGQDMVAVQYRADPMYADPEEERYLSPPGSKTAIARPNPAGRPSVICEGLLDAYLLAQYGIDAVTTTGGSGSLALVLREKFSGPCLVMTDLDEAGEAAWQSLSRKRPGLVRVRWPKGKDVTEALSGITVEKRAEQLFRWIQEALSGVGSHFPYE